MLWICNTAGACVFLYITFTVYIFNFSDCIENATGGTCHQD